MLRGSDKKYEKFFYKIGEVSYLTGVRPYVLRYWESEFPFLHPRKNKGGQRVYVKEDIETIKRIKEMLYKEGYTIKGVKRSLLKRRDERNKEERAISPYEEIIYRIKEELQDILKIL